MSWFVKRIVFVSAYLILDAPRCLVINAQRSIGHIDPYQEESLFEFAMPYLPKTEPELYRKKFRTEDFHTDTAQYLPYSTQEVQTHKREKLVNEDHTCQGSSCKMNDSSQRRHHHKRLRSFHSRHRDKWRSHKKDPNKHPKLHHRRNSSEFFQAHSSPQDVNIFHGNIMDSKIKTQSTEDDDLILRRGNESETTESGVNDHVDLRSHKSVNHQAEVSPRPFFNLDPQTFRRITEDPPRSSTDHRTAREPIKIKLKDDGSPLHQRTLSDEPAKNRSSPNQRRDSFFDVSEKRHEKGKEWIESHLAAGAIPAKLATKNLLEKTKVFRNATSSNSSITHGIPDDKKTPESDKTRNSGGYHQIVKDGLSFGHDDRINSFSKQLITREQNAKPSRKSPSYISFLRQTVQAKNSRCYSITDLMMTIIVTILANLFAGALVMLLICCMSPRFRRVSSSRRGGKNVGYGVVQNYLDSTEEENSGSVGCLEACLPDISYQRHIARGFTKKLVKIHVPFNGHSSKHHKIYKSFGSSPDATHGIHTNTSPLLGRKSLSLEDIRIT